MAPKPKILYVAGTGRCGSTIIEAALSQIQSIMALGEVRYLWERGLIQNRLTGDGTPFSNNPFWQKVIAEIPQTQPLNPLRMRDLFFKNNASKKDFSKYSAALKQLYTAISKNTDATILIDSSKIPNYLYALIDADIADIYILHVTRDPRAVIHSWQNPKFDRGKGAMMSKKGFLGALLEAIFINRWITRDFSSHPHFLHMNYEDFCAHPRQSLDKILSWLNIHGDENPLNDKGVFTLTHNHPTISGNPIRFDGGEITVQLDTKWQKKLPFWQKAVTNIAIFLHKITS